MVTSRRAPPQRPPPTPIAQVYLSHRTVGHHLYRAYPKLGITRRGELAQLTL